MSLQIIRQDITKISVDAIVNVTNSQMCGVSGIDRIVHIKAGARFDADCRSRAPLGLGEAKMTLGYNLPCKFVIHTACPEWNGGLFGEKILLKSCYLESLKLAKQSGFNTVAIPLIGADSRGYPKEEILKFAVQTISEFLLEHDLFVYLCICGNESYVFNEKLFGDIQAFICNDNSDWNDFVENSNCLDNFTPERRIVSEMSSAAGKTLNEYVVHRGSCFQEMLFALIDERGMSDVECYKKANIDKRIFAKIRANKQYQPSKQTAVAFAIALRLDLETTQKFLASAGMTLSRANTFDKIIRYFIHNANYNIFEINEALFAFDQTLLGSGN